MKAINQIENQNNLIFSESIEVKVDCKCYEVKELIESTLYNTKP